MSGFEIVGVALGALPLVVLAFENLRDTFDRVHLLANFNDENLDVYSEAKTEELLLRQQMRLLLTPLVQCNTLDGVELESLMLDPNDDLWVDPDVSKALRCRLGESYSRFLEIVEEIHSLAWHLLESLAKSTEFLNQGAQKRVTKRQSLMVKAYHFLSEKYSHESRRMRTVFTKTWRREQLTAIHKKIKVIERLLSSEDKVATFEQVNKASVTSRSVNNLVGYWRHAARIHALLLMSWVCPCRQRHCANLWLQHHTSDQFEFRILVLSTRTGGNAHSASWQQHGLKISGPLDETVVRNLIAATIAPPPPRPLQPPVQARGPSKLRIMFKPGKGKQSASACVRFSKSCSSPNLMPLTSGRNSATTKTVTATIDPKPFSKRTRFEVSAVDRAANSTPETTIKDLCHSMEQCGMQQGHSLGVLIDDARGCRYRVSSQPEQKLAADEVTLSELIRRGNNASLLREQRIQIALKVASSHLQLRSTPWASRQWESEDVRFPQTGHDTASVMIDRPFISAEFKDAPQNPERSPNPTDRSFAGLGIMLLELFFGIEIEQHDLYKQLDGLKMERSVRRLVVARQWADEVESENVPEFVSAVMWCLNRSPITLQGDEWRRDLAYEVVLPLQNCCNWIGAAF